MKPFTYIRKLSQHIYNLNQIIHSCEKHPESITNLWGYYTSYKISLKYWLNHGPKQYRIKFDTLEYPFNLKTLTTDVIQFGRKGKHHNEDWETAVDALGKMLRIVENERYEILNKTKNRRPIKTGIDDKPLKNLIDSFKQL